MVLLKRKKKKMLIVRIGIRYCYNEYIKLKQKISYSSFLFYSLIHGDTKSENYFENYRQPLVFGCECSEISLAKKKKVSHGFLCQIFSPYNVACSSLILPICRWKVRLEFNSKLTFCIVKRGFWLQNSFMKYKIIRHKPISKSHGTNKIPFFFIFDLLCWNSDGNIDVWVKNHV